MVAFSLTRCVKTVSLSVLGTFAMAASPVAAQTLIADAQNSALLEDTSDTAETGYETGLEDGDAQLSQLFADWTAMDSGVEAPVVTVSIPSRMPLDNASLTSEYGMRTHPVLGRRRAHKGVDLAAPTGTPIYATADGVISKASRFSSYGLYISIEHGAELQTRFAHLSKIAVSNGERVKKGDLIGYVGSTGRSTGPHLHYEVRIAGKAVNPIPYMVESEAQQAYTLATRDKDAARGGD